MSLENVIAEEKILSVLMDIKSLAEYQVKLLETMVSNSDDMIKRASQFNPKQQIDALQKMVPGNIDLGKIFSSAFNKNNSTTEKKE